MRGRLRVAYRTLCVLAALAPPLHILWLVLTVGENNLSNDYIAAVPLVAAVLDGSYRWEGFFKDTLGVGLHPTAVPFLLTLAGARLTHWDLRFELVTGFLLFAGALALFGLALTRSVQSEARWLLWPSLSLLTFSTAHITTFMFGGLSVGFGMNLFGLGLGTWALARFGGSLRTAGWMGAGALLASWSWASGLTLWPVFGFALALASRRAAPVLVLGAIGLLTAGPYVRPFLAAHRSPAIGERSLSWSGFIVQLLGRPFVNDSGGHFGALPYSGVIGCLGLALGVAGLLLLPSIGADGRRRALPALTALAWSLAVVAEIAAARRQIAPWYIGVASCFWIGLLGLLFVIADRVEGRARSVSFGGFLLLAGAVAFLGVRVNRTWRDKDFYLPSRAPASAACLRESWTAPTWCEGFVFQWGTGNPELLSRFARPLKELRLSVFAPRQTWLLQGDQALDHVIVETPLGGDVFWRTASGEELPWTDPRRLELVLPPGARVLWTLSLPAGLREARFRSRVSLLGAADPSDAGEIEILGPPPARRTLAVIPLASGIRRVPVDVPLLAGAGRTVTLSLRFASSAFRPGTHLAFASPRLEILDETPPSIPPAVTPSNTDLSPDVPVTADSDLQLPIGDTKLWRFEGLHPDEGATFSIADFELRPGGFAETTGELGIPFRDLTHLSLQLRLPAGIDPSRLRLRFAFQGGSWPTASQTVELPVLHDGALHRYVYDLALLGISPWNRLVSLRIEPLEGAPPLPARRLTLGDIRLLKRCAAW